MEMVPSTSPESMQSYDSCLRFISRWLVINEYKDPCCLLPFPYRDRKQLHVIVKRAGGMIRLANSVSKILGAEIPKDLGTLQRGDIGLVKAPHEIEGKRFFALAFAIKDVTTRWALKAENGVQFLPLQPIAGWHIKQVCDG